MHCALVNVQYVKYAVGHIVHIVCIVISRQCGNEIYAYTEDWETGRKKKKWKNEGNNLNLCGSVQSQLLDLRLNTVYLIDFIDIIKSKVVQNVRRTAYNLEDLSHLVSATRRSSESCAFSNDTREIEAFAPTRLHQRCVRDCWRRQPRLFRNTFVWPRCNLAWQEQQI